MKHKAYRFISFMLAAVVLFSSAGFTRYEHTCNFTQIKTVNLFENGHCCSDEKIDKDFGPLAFKKGPCCDIQKDFISLHSNSDSTPHFKIPVLVAAFSHSLVGLNFTSNFLSFEKTFYLSHCKSPPIAGRRLLNFIQSYLI